MICSGSSFRPLPLVLPPLADELLSSWFNRHATFYRVSGRRLLRHCSLEAPSPRDLDLKLTPHDQHRLAHVFRYDPRVIRKMTQSWGRSLPTRLIASVRPMQVCRCCISRHHAEPLTRGTRLRSWMEGWRIICPVCSAAMEDSRPLNMLTRTDPADPLFLRVAEHARQGELMMTRAAHLGRPSEPIVALMRSLLLPRTSCPRETSSATEIPRLLDTVVPGFDRFLHQTYPGFRRPGTLLLPISIRVPVLAGVAQVASRPDHWAESLIGAVAETARPGLAACFRELMAA